MSNRGFSLIACLVAMALLSLFCTGLLTQQMHYYQFSKQQMLIQQKLQHTATHYEEQLRF